MKIKIGKKYVGDEQPFYSIAEIGSNFDNSIKKAFKFEQDPIDKAQLILGQVV